MQKHRKLAFRGQNLFNGINENILISSEELVYALKCQENINDFINIMGPIYDILCALHWNKEHQSRVDCKNIRCIYLTFTAMVY